MTTTAANATPPAPRHAVPYTGLGARMMADHAEISTLFDELLAAFRCGDRDVAAEAFRRFERRLEAHLAIEETLLFPALRQIDPVEVATLEGDHRGFRARLLELGVGVDLHLTRATWVSAFVDALRAHARREEALLYRWADEASAAIDRDAVLRRLAHAG